MIRGRHWPLSQSEISLFTISPKHKSAAILLATPSRWESTDNFSPTKIREFFVKHPNLYSIGFNVFDLIWGRANWILNSFSHSFLRERKWPLGIWSREKGSAWFPHLDSPWLASRQMFCLFLSKLFTILILYLEACFRNRWWLLQD